MKSENDTTRVPYFSTSRFGPSTIVLLAILAIASFVLYRLGAFVFAGTLLACDALILAVKSFEVLRYGRPEERKFEGKRCTVIIETDRGKRGVVRMIRDNGMVDPELWSAEAKTRIGVGEEAMVTGIESIVLHIEPLKSQRKPGALDF